MKITIYGSGCSNCIKLADNAKAAAEELGIEYKVEKVEDPAEIAKAGIMSTPGLAINDKIKTKGQVPSKEKIKEMLSN